MTTHTFNDETGYTLNINSEGGELWIKSPSGIKVFFLRPEDRLAIANAIHPQAAPEPMFKANASFDDIQRGDTIRWSYKADDITFTREGTAGDRVGDWWDTPEGRSLVAKPSRQPQNITIHILSRPTPQLPTQPGTVIWIIEGKIDTLTFTNTPATLNKTGYWSAVSDQGHSARIHPEHITTWEPLNHVTKEN